MNKRINGITLEALKMLTFHSWKGNIRELKNIIERVVILENTDQITIETLPYDLQIAAA